MSHDDNEAEKLARIYWVVPRLEQEVHAGALGFTKVLYYYVWATNPEQAKDLMRAHLAGEGLAIERFMQTPSLAQNQVMSTYCFPEQIVGLPEKLIVQQLKPGVLKDMVLKAHKVRSEQLQRGQKSLATPAATA